MIGLALHLGQRALDGLVDRLLPLPVSLALGLCRETSEVERLGAECDQLRDERDRARASLSKTRPTSAFRTCCRRRPGCGS